MKTGLRACIPLAVLLSCAAAAAQPLDKIKLPPHFSISVFAAEVPGARSMTLGRKGAVFVGSREQGKVYALLPSTDGTRAEKTYVIAKGLNNPNGVAFRDDSLFVAEIDKILRFEQIEKRLADPAPPALVTRRYPSKTHHGWKFIAFGPDGRLYVPVGAPCNLCEAGEPYASITSIRPDGGDFRIFARGIRNTVGFDWHPLTGELWFTDNGRDRLGDDLPPDELDHAPRAGMNFGYPRCFGKNRPDPEAGKGGGCNGYTGTALDLPAHTAALGMRFYTGAMFPSEYKNQIFIAEHGSWNRTTPIGYRVSLVRLEENRAINYSVFAEGWLSGGQAWGRPVDVLVMPDGALLVSDDKGGRIYRIRYQHHR